MVITNEKTLGELVAEIPGAARILEKYRIDYCCGGKHALEAACRERGITQGVLLSELEQAATLQPQTGEREWSTAPLRELIEHIFSRHHAYLKSELPRIAELFAKVVRAHAGHEPVLFQLRDFYRASRRAGGTHDEGGADSVSSHRRT
jgi:regulator of cell morphogenesis and NO signaling